MNSLLAGLLLYFVLMLVIGLICFRYMNTLDDYVLGGRRLGPWVSAISERASGESAWFLLGLPGAAYALGLTLTNVPRLGAVLINSLRARSSCLRSS